MPHRFVTDRSCPLTGSASKIPVLGRIAGPACAAVAAVALFAASARADALPAGQANLGW